MSMYNMLFGRNPAAPIYLAMLGLTPDDTGRFRDCFLQRALDEEPRIIVYTRNGGGNREEYAGTTEFLQSHPEYVNDFDDDFDCTYASYIFKVPEKFKDAVKLLLEEPGQVVDPGVRFQELLAKLNSGDKDDPQVMHAMEVGERILGPIIEHLNKEASK